MNATMLMTLGASLRKARVTNATDNGYPAKIPTITKPSGLGDAAAQTTASVFGSSDIYEAKDMPGQNGLFICFYGVGSNNNTFSCRFINWKHIGGTTPQTGLWIPFPLFEVAVTLSSTQPGIAGMTILNTELFADTITLTGTTANDDVDITITSPANDTIAHLLVDSKAPRLIEPIFTTGGSATSANALWAPI